MQKFVSTELDRQTDEKANGVEEGDGERDRHLMMSGCLAPKENCHHLLPGLGFKLSLSLPLSLSPSLTLPPTLSLCISLSPVSIKTHTHTLSNITYICLPERHGVMDNAVACHAGGPGLIPAISKWFFLSSLRWWVKMEPVTIIGVI